MDYSIQILDRAVAVLLALARSPGSNITQVANETGLTKTLVLRILFTLRKHNLVIKEDSGKTYSLAYQSLHLLQQANTDSRLLEVAQPLMDRLAAECGETVSLVVRDGLNAVYLAVKESKSAPRQFAQTGRRGPLHVGAGPKVLLAFAPDEISSAVLNAPLPVCTPATITDPEKLAAVLAHIRRTGLTENYGDLDNHGFGFGAPIYGAEDVVAALSIAGPLSRLTPDVAHELKQGVVTYARAISDALSAGSAGSAHAGQVARETTPTTVDG